MGKGMLPLAAYTDSDWSHWFGNVQPGELTPHAKQVLRLMARDTVKEYGLTCKDLAIVADSTCHRDLESAQVFAEELGCREGIVEGNATLFNDNAGDAARGIDAVNETRFAAAIEFVQQWLLCCKEGCEGKERCSVQDLPRGVTMHATDRPKLGPLALVSYVAEMLQMAVCNGVRTG